MSTLQQGGALAARPRSRSGGARAAPWRRWAEWVPYAAALWSAAYGAAAVHWARGGAGFPFGAGHDPWAHLSALRGVRPETAAPVIAAVGFAAAAVALATTRVRRPRAVHVALLAVAWALAVALTVALPDTRVLAAAAYAPLLVVGPLFGWSPDGQAAQIVSWPIVNQFVCVGGGLLWAATAVVYRRRAADVCAYCGRSARTAGWATPRAAARWGRWATAVAVAIPPTYALTRVSWAFGIPLGTDAAGLRAVQAVSGPGVLGTPLGLGCVALAGALLTVGLVRPWGVTFPRLLPIVGGRRVPPALAIVPASLVAVLAFAGGLGVVRMWIGGSFAIPEGLGWLATVPMLLWPVWGAALGAATLAYHLRRRGACAHCGRA